MWQLWRRRWKGKPVTELDDGQQARALSSEATYRLAVAHRRESTIEARGDRLADLARKAMGERK
jgi:hypothetical protein